MQTMDYGKAFTFPQQDADWIKKFVIAALIMLIPLFGALVVGGYLLELMRRVINDDAKVLPDWADFGGFFRMGLLGAVVQFVYALPIIVLVGCAYTPMMSAAFVNDPDTADMLATSGGILAACCGCLALLYALALGLVLPAAQARLAVTGEIGAAFRFNEVLALVRAQPAVYLIVMLISSITISVLSSITILGCLVGSVFGLAYGLLVTAHLHGQAYRVASGVTGGSASAGMTMA
jgi:hypothetical protein